jgi:hypothetical protein
MEHPLLLAFFQGVGIAVGGGVTFYVARYTAKFYNGIMCGLALSRLGATPQDIESHSMMIERGHGPFCGKLGCVVCKHFNAYTMAPSGMPMPPPPISPPPIDPPK